MKSAKSITTIATITTIAAITAITAIAALPHKNKINFYLHNSKKSSTFALETEDGVAGGAHAEPIQTDEAKVHTPSIEVSS